MLGLAEAGPVRRDGGDDRTFVAEVDLDLAQILAWLQQRRRVRMAQRMNRRRLGDAAGLEGETKGALQGGAAERFGGGGGALAAVAFGGAEQDGMPVRFPLLAQQQQRALGPRDVTILMALAPAEVQEPALGSDVANFEPQPFAQAQAAGVNGAEADAMIQGGHGG